MAMPLNTYSKLLLNEWPALTQLIWQHGKTLSSPAECPAGLPDEIIDAAMHSPYQPFLQNKLSALAQIEQVRTAFLAQKNESLKEAAQQGLLTPADFPPVPESIIEQVSLGDLENLQQQVFELISLHHDAWQHNVERWQTQLLNSLAATDLNLSPDEIDNFRLPERVSDLVNQAAEVNLSLSKQEKITNDFKNYLTLKTLLSIHNALSREQRPHEPKDIAIYIKACQSVLTQIGREEKSLNDLQVADTNRLIDVLRF